MKKLMGIVRKAMTVAAFLTISVAADAAEVMYKIVEYNKQTAEFAIAACGTVPRNSRVDFENKFGATTGNRYNQIPRNHEAVLYLEGWQGCKVRSITFSMCSNNKKGQVGVSLNDGGTTLYSLAPVDFASADWFGEWVSKDLGVYVDVVSVTSTADVTCPDVLRFTLNKSADQQHWTLTDQLGRQLGATGKQKLAWNEGITEWNIALDHEGATLTPTNEAYGTMRYSTPDNSYARFNLYTSKTLPLPFLYRKGEQKQPELSRSISFAEKEMTVSLDVAHIGLRPTFMPKTTTDKRLHWKSSNESVATVTGGYVTLLSVGEATITATTYDSGVETTMHLVVTEPTAINGATNDAKVHSPRKVLDGNKVVIVTEQGCYGTGGWKAGRK